MRKKTENNIAYHEPPPLEGIARCLISLENEALKCGLDELSKVIRLAREEAEGSLLGPLRKAEGLLLEYGVH